MFFRLIPCILSGSCTRLLSPPSTLDPQVTSSPSWPSKHLLFTSFTSIKLIEKLSVLLDCCECSSFGCVDVSHAFKPHVASRPNVCIPCGDFLTKLCPKQGCEQLVTQGYYHYKSIQIIPNHIICHSSCPKLMPMKLCRFFHQDQNLVVSVIFVTPGHLSTPNRSLSGVRPPCSTSPQATTVPEDFNAQNAEPVAKMCLKIGWKAKPDEKAMRT